MTETTPAPEALVRLTHAIYGLHAFSAVMGIVSSAAVVTTFLTGWPSILAVILNYVKRGDVRGTYLESHFRWQIRTLWWACFWVLVAIVLVLTIIGSPLAWLMIVTMGIWVLYRIVRGWMLLNEGRAVTMDELTRMAPGFAISLACAASRIHLRRITSCAGFSRISAIPSCSTTCSTNRTTLWFGNPMVRR